MKGGQQNKKVYYTPRSHCLFGWDGRPVRYFQTWWVIKGIVQDYCVSDPDVLIGSWVGVNDGLIKSCDGVFRPFHDFSEDTVFTIQSVHVGPEGDEELWPEHVVSRIHHWQGPGGFVFHFGQEVSFKEACLWLPSGQVNNAVLILYSRLETLAGWLGAPWTYDAAATLFPSFLLLWW